MLSLSRSLFDDFFSLHRELDNLFERSWGPSALLLPTLGGQPSSFYPEVESFTKDGKIVYRMAIPGVDPKNVHLSIVGNQVTIKGERSGPAEVRDEDWYVREFRYGQFERTFILPEGVEADKVNATFTNGVLEISAPVAKAHLPRKIEIKQLSTGEQKQQLKASA
jgi:HSP20 family protein